MLRQIIVVAFPSFDLLLEILLETDISSESHETAISRTIWHLVSIRLGILRLDANGLGIIMQLKVQVNFTKKQIVAYFIFLVGHMLKLSHIFFLHWTYSHGTIEELLINLVIILAFLQVFAQLPIK